MRWSSSAGTPGPLIGEGQMGEPVVTGQVHQDLASRRGERSGIVDQIFSDAFDHLLGAEHEKPGDKIR